MASSSTTYGIRALPRLPAKQPFPAGDHAVSQLFAEYREAGRRSIAEPFKGITTDGQVIPNLFSIAPTGVSTEPIRQAAEAFLASLDAEGRRAAQFGVGDSAWRAWSNIHPFVMRHGVVLDDCSATQRERALDLLRATCSARGFGLARDIMRLNEALGELTGRPAEYGEWYYWLSIFGQPAPDQPWGWQIDGHHLIVNCFVLGDQMVVSPTFLGSEPTHVETGKHAGLRVLSDEEQRGLEFVRGLSHAQRELALPVPTESVLRPQRMDGRIQTAAFQDNRVIGYAGIPGADLSDAQRTHLLELIDVYVSRMREGHARVRLDEVARHLDPTRLVWVGGLEDDSVFYYRIQSPVILIEFDHLNGIAFDNDEVSRNHIHTVVRTPNGNDYGKDLLRQHLERDHAPRSVGPRS
ncbi:MAG: DUF3500 domain-containing protein [Chloroflexi bacterium]|nr:DUF3500 domain-containing protein [Chloroflexota bacterium]MBV9595710.1 DUF3500 domain-containing protein [Chloroflexota bacterium]